MEWLLIPAIIAAAFAANGDADIQRTQVGLYTGPDGGASVAFFHEQLDPYGRWIEAPPYGAAWVPAGIGPDWRPYGNGYWLYTDAGWGWMSYEPFGPVVYHYGRWTYEPLFGWVWIPDTVWSPAWVSWRYSDDWVGWAPLPPGAVWSAGVGLRWRGARVVPVTSWSFVDGRYFLAKDVGRRVLPPGRNADLLRVSRDATWFENRNGRPFNRGVEAALAERWTGKPVRIEKVAGPRGPERDERPDRGRSLEPAREDRDLQPSRGRERRDVRPDRGSDRRAVEQGHGSPSKASQGKASPGKASPGKGSQGKGSQGKGSQGKGSSGKGNG